MFLRTVQATAYLSLTTEDSLVSGVKRFQELHCWQRARGLSRDIFWLSEEGRFKQDRRLWAQINDSSESVMANIAEGFGRGTQSQFIVFLGYSLGSLNEIQSHLCTAFDRKYIAEEDYRRLFGEAAQVGKMMVAFMRSMVLPGSGVKDRNRPKQISLTEQAWRVMEKATGMQRPEMFRAENAGKFYANGTRIPGK